MQIHYFQRYHSKENVDTSNTMLMLSRLYNYNADKFFSMLNSLILGDDESPEITFDLQVAGDESVPDAVISQKSFKIVVETKLYNQFDKQQPVNHLEQFGAEDIKVLLTIDPRPMKQQLFDEMTVELKKYNSENMERLIHPIKHVNLTFEQLVEAMEDIIEEIMGNIRDEYDEEEEMIRKSEDGSYLVDGLCGLTELSDVLGIVFQDEDEDNEYETLNGFLIVKLERIPAEKEECSVFYEGYLFEIQQVINNIIRKVKITKTELATETKE